MEQASQRHKHSTVIQWRLFRIAAKVAE